MNTNIKNCNIELLEQQKQQLEYEIVYGENCCSSNYLQLHVALYLQPFPRLSQMPHHIIQARLCT